MGEGQYTFVFFSRTKGWFVSVLTYRGVDLIYRPTYCLYVSAPFLYSFCICQFYFSDFFFCFCVYLFLLFFFHFLLFPFSSLPLSLYLLSPFFLSFSFLTCLFPPLPPLLSLPTLLFFFNPPPLFS